MLSLYIDSIRLTTVRTLRGGSVVMAQRILADGRGRPDFCGLDSLFEFTNADGRLCRTNCGQAAAATFLTHHGKLSLADGADARIMADLERDHPPDQFFGLFGTGRRQVERICQQYEQPLQEIGGEENLRRSLGRRQPVIVMLGVSAGRLFNRFDLPGGHWMVAFGCDDEQVYLSNWGAMPWAEFHRGWRSPVPRLIGMGVRGLTAAG
jgi:hypothetical protein